MDLPSLLGVDLVHCERAAEAAVKDSGGALLQVGQGLWGGVRVCVGGGGRQRRRRRPPYIGNPTTTTTLCSHQAQGELFSPSYFDVLAAEVDDELQGAGEGPGGGGGGGRVGGAVEG